MTVLQNSFHTQRFHDYARWLGFHYRYYRLMQVIRANVIYSFMKQSYLPILAFYIPAFLQRSFPYRTAVFIIALDISQEELDYNHDVDEKIVFDITSGNKVPLDDDSVDMITSRYVLEHLKNLDNAFSEVSRILKPGGKFISLFPNKFTLFAIINQILPHWLARKILFSINPGAKGHCGFRAYYKQMLLPCRKKIAE